MLRRLVLRGVRMTALMGRGAAPVGDAGGEAVILTTPGGIEIRESKQMKVGSHEAQRRPGVK